MAEEYLTVAQAAAVMNTHKQTVYRMVWAGELPWVDISRGKKNRRIRIRRSALDQEMTARERSRAA